MVDPDPAANQRDNLGRNARNAGPAQPPTRVERLVSWLMKKLGRERFDIGPPDNVYLTRWTLLGSRFGKPNQHRLFLHRFHRSDNQTLHDHPWNFWSLLLWPGYYEHQFNGVVRCDGVRETERRWYWPGTLLRRTAETCHRVELAPGRKAWTLVWTGPRVRSWFFHCNGNRPPVPYKEFLEREAHGNGCGDVG